MHSYSYVPGVTVTGKVSSSGNSTLVIGGRRAARGTLKISAKGTITGVLGGRRVHPTGSRPAMGGLESSAVLAPSRLSALVASPYRLAALRAESDAAILQAVLSPGR
jgi:hypothetical protein